jgi:hypothetical protein
LIPAHSQIYDQNLVQNPGAETGTAAQNATDAKVASIPNWTTTGGFSVGSYDGGSFLTSGDYGPNAGHGTKFFYAGPGIAKSTAVQTVDLASHHRIDAGKVKFYLSGYVGWIPGSYDGIEKINLKAEFLDAGGNTLLTSVAAAPTAAGGTRAPASSPAGLHRLRRLILFRVLRQRHHVPGAHAPGARHHPPVAPQPRPIFVGRRHGGQHRQRLHHHRQPAEHRGRQVERRGLDLLV